MKRSRGRGTRRARRAAETPEAARRESKQVDFKKSFDIESTGEWCEVIKDMVAMANSGGGALSVGVLDDGKPSGADCAPLLTLDPAKIVDKIESYTTVPFGDFEVRPGERGGTRIAIIKVQGVFPPMVFTREGSYDVPLPDGKKKTKMAFAKGTLYFRHGAKSEPANSHDLKTAFDRRLAAERKSLMSNLSKVVAMAEGSEVQVIPREVAKSGDPRAVAVRLVDDPRVPTVRALDLDQTHPFRQTELLKELNKRLGGKVNVTGHQVQCIRRAHGIDQNPTYSHQPKFATRQYSAAFLDWMVDQYNRDAEFFTKARLVGARK
jgi:hypothetical protein